MTLHFIGKFHQSAEEEFFEAKAEPNNQVSKILSDYIEEIQKNSFYSEMPEFNIKKISGESSIFYIPLKTKDFLDHFFANKALLLASMVERFESEERADSPF